MEKNCNLQFNPETKDVEVTFTGEWARVDIDRCYKKMLNSLPAYLFKQREILKEGETGDGTRERKRRRREES